MRRPRRPGAGLRQRGVAHPRLHRGRRGRGGQDQHPDPERRDRPAQDRDRVQGQPPRLHDLFGGRLRRRVQRYAGQRERPPAGADQPHHRGDDRPGHRLSAPGGQRPLHRRGGGPPAGAVCPAGLRRAGQDPRPGAGHQPVHLHRHRAAGPHPPRGPGDGRPGPGHGPGPRRRPGRRDDPRRLHLLRRRQPRGGKAEQGPQPHRGRGPGGADQGRRPCGHHGPPDERPGRHRLGGRGAAHLQDLRCARRHCGQAGGHPGHQPHQRHRGRRPGGRFHRPPQRPVHHHQGDFVHRGRYIPGRPGGMQRDPGKVRQDRRHRPPPQGGGLYRKRGPGLPRALRLLGQRAGHRAAAVCGQPGRQAHPHRGRGPAVRHHAGHPQLQPAHRRAHL